jgi:hypothetical protein
MNQFIPTEQHTISDSQGKLALDYSKQQNMSTIKKIMDANARRIDALRKAFADLQTDMDTRKFLLNHWSRDGRYCQSCSPLNKVGKCGPACALLRPDNRSGTFFSVPETWRREARSQIRQYKVAVADMQRHGYNISLAEIVELEELARGFRLDGMSNVEKMTGHEQPISIRMEFSEVSWSGNGLDSELLSRLTLGEN